MKREMLDGWIAALRSKQFAQTTGQLKYKDGFCCLGVLCHLQDPEGFYDVDTDHKFAGNGNYSNLEKLLGETMVEVLWNMNDRDRASFDEIADFLEANREQIEAKE